MNREYRIERDSNGDIKASVVRVVAYHDTRPLNEWIVVAVAWRSTDVNHRSTNTYNCYDIMGGGGVRLANCDEEHAVGWLLRYAHKNVRYMEELSETAQG